MIYWMDAETEADAVVARYDICQIRIGDDLTARIAYLVSELREVSAKRMRNRQRLLSAERFMHIVAGLGKCSRYDLLLWNSYRFKAHKLFHHLMETGGLK